MNWRCAISLLFVLIVARPTLGATYYVSTTGNDVNACSTTDSAGTNKKTVVAGIGCLTQNNGDTLVIHAGTYNEGDILFIPGGVSWANATTVRGATGETVTIKSPAASEFVFRLNNISTHYVILDNLILDNDLGNNSVVKLNDEPCCNVDHIRIQNSEIKNSDRSGILSGADTGSGMEFLNLRVHNVARIDPSPDVTGHGIYLAGPDQLVSGCTVNSVGVTNQASGIQSYHNGFSNTNNIIRNNYVHDVTGPGLYLWSGDNLAYNNVVAHNGFYGINASQQAEIYNNTIYDNVQAAIFVNAATTVIARNNIFWANDTDDVDNSGGTVTKDHNLTTDPSFVNAATGNFHISSTSAAKAAGLDLSAIFTTDFDGLTRTVPWDAGAFKYPGGDAPLGFEIRRNTAQAGTATTITLDTNASSTTNFYVNGPNIGIALVSGTGAEQFRTIIGYNGTTKVATVSPAWATNPDVTSVFVIAPKSGGIELRRSTAQGGTASTITLDSGASSMNGYYSRAGTAVLITSGTGAGQVRTIIGYVGSTRVATVSVPWTTPPDNMSGYVLFMR